MDTGPRLSVTIVSGLDQWLQAMSIRAEVYIGEQDYRYREEFDGADLAGATHLLALEDGEPVGACRIRWFADFAKLERVAVQQRRRSGRIPRALWRATAELAARKGYRVVLGHIERSLLPFWGRIAGFKVRASRPSYTLKGREFVEATTHLPPHAQAVSIDSAPAMHLAPEAQLASAGEALPFRRAS